MRILILNPNTTEAVTSLMLAAGRAVASPGGVWASAFWMSGLRSAGFPNQSRRWTGPLDLRVTRSALSFILTAAKIIVKNPPA